MNKFLIALTIGIIAGIIDVIPMIIKKMDKTANLSAFIHYLALGLIIPFVNWGITDWLKGIIISLLTSIPVLIIVMPKDKKAAIPIIAFSIILGAAIGFVGAKFI